MSSLLGGIEAGGTKFICAIGTGPDDIHALQRFPTRTPEETLQQVVGFFRAQPQLPDAIGIGCFGPVDVRKSSPQYGYITATPKPQWPYTDVAGYISRALCVPVGFDTDVNAAALAEHVWGAGRDCPNILYITIGTGIGGGALVNGRPVHGLMHPEMGHMYIPKSAHDDFAGICPYHGNCLEGLATGPAMAARWGQPAETLVPDHPAWELEAHYLGLAVSNLILVLSPERVIMGGGLMQNLRLFSLIHEEVLARLNGYVCVPAITESIEDYIVPPALGQKAGVVGAMELSALML